MHQWGNSARTAAIAAQTATQTDTSSNAAAKTNAWQMGVQGTDGAGAWWAESNQEQGERRRGLFGGRFRRRFQPSPEPTPKVTPEPSPKVTPEPSPKVETPPEPVKEAPELPSVMPTHRKLEGCTGKEVIEGWEQGRKGNCVTVAAIKAAQTTFGPNLADKDDSTKGIFSSAKHTDKGGLDIVMRDGFKLSLTKEELEQASNSSDFSTDKDREDLLDNAQQLYAVAAKRAQLEGNDGFGPGKMSFSQALRSLEDGEWTANVMEQVGRLGLKEYAKKVSRSEMKNYDSSLSSGDGHAYFVSEGVRDHYGTPGKLGGEAYYTRGAFGRQRYHAGHSSTGTVLQNKKVKKDERESTKTS